MKRIMKHIVFTFAALVAICSSQLSHAERFRPGTAEAIGNYGRAMAAASGAIFDTELEARFRKSDPVVLSMLPAVGFRNGAAGFFKRFGLYVVPTSAEAWCQDAQRGKLAPGCYLMAMLQIKGFKALTRDGFYCGSPARWYKAPGHTAYIPIPSWPGLAARIAEGDSAFVLAFIKDDNRRLCD